MPTRTYSTVSRGDPITTLDCDPAAAPPITNNTAYAEWANICDHDTYCEILDLIITPDTYICLENSILELWPSSQDFGALSEDEILSEINRVPLVGKFGSIDIDTYITPIRNDSGYIIGAESLSLSLFGQSNTSLITEDDLSNAEDGVPVSRKLFSPPVDFFWFPAVWVDVLLPLDRIKAEKKSCPKKKNRIGNDFLI